MFKTNFMNDIRMPTWDLLAKLEFKTELKSLKEIHDDDQVMEAAGPVLKIIEKAFLCCPSQKESTHDPILRLWKNTEWEQKTFDFKLRMERTMEAVAETVTEKMSALDDAIFESMTHEIKAGWYKVPTRMFKDGATIIIYPKAIENAVRFKETIDPTQFDETPTQEEDEFHVINSQSLFTIPEEEEMEIIHIEAVNE